MINPNMARWIRASIYKYYSEQFNGTKVYFEGQTIDFSSSNFWFEVRLNGPNANKINDAFFVEIDIMCSVKNQGSFLYKLDELIGKAQESFEPIVVKKYGDGAGNDGSTVGCLKLNGDIDVNYWGLISTEVETRNASVVAPYKLEI